MQCCCKEHVKTRNGAADSIIIDRHQKPVCRWGWGVATENFRRRSPKANSNCVPDKAPEKAPADLLGVSFPDAQERREVGCIGVREEREGEEEKEGKRRMGDGLILGGGENEGGGFLHSAKDWAATCPPPLVEGNGRRKPCPPPTSSEGPASQSPSPRPSNKSTIGKRLGASSDHQPFFFALFRANRALVPTVPVVPVPVGPVPNLPFPFLSVARPAAIFDAVQS